MSRGIRDVERADRAEPIRLVVVDDDRWTVGKIREMVSGQKDIELAGVAWDGGQAIKLLGLLRADVVLMNGLMPGMDGVEATKRIRRLQPDLRVVFESMWFSLKRYPLPVIAEHVRRVQAAGARGWLGCPPEQGELLRTVRRLGAEAREVGAYEGASFRKGPMVQIIARPDARLWLRIKDAVFGAGYDVWLASPPDDRLGLMALGAIPREAHPDPQMTVVVGAVVWRTASVLLMEKPLGKIVVVAADRDQARASWRAPNAVVNPMVKDFPEQIVSMVKALPSALWAEE